MRYEPMARHVDAAMLAATTDTEADEWSFDSTLGEWSYPEDADAPGWRVLDEGTPEVTLEWGELVMRWCRDGVDELADVMRRLRRAADAFNNEPVAAPPNQDSEPEPAAAGDAEKQPR